MSAAGVVIMDIADSDRYREAVARLRVLLDEPALPEYSSARLSGKGHHAILEHYSAVTGTGGSDPDAREGRVEATSRWLLELLRHQEELIAQLEKENEFLKGEVVAVGREVQQLAQDNLNLNRRLADALSHAVQSEDSEATSSRDAEADDDPHLQVVTLTREKLALEDRVERLDSALSAMTQREQDALTKLRTALALAQDTHTHTAQVRTSSESALEELSALLALAKQENKELQQELNRAKEKQNGEQEQQDRTIAQQQEQLKRVECELAEKEAAVSNLRQQVQEGARTIEDLQYDLQAARAARQRLEVQLEDQRQHSKDAHSRLDQLIMARTEEAASGTARARELEERLNAARHDTSRLLHTISTLAQGPGRRGDLHTTDDDKTEQQAAQGTLSAAIEALQSRHESEVAALKEAAGEQSKAVDALREEVARMCHQLTQDSDTFKTLLEDVGRNVASLAAAPDREPQLDPSADDKSGVDGENYDKSSVNTPAIRVIEPDDDDHEMNGTAVPESEAQYGFPGDEDSDKLQEDNYSEDKEEDDIITQEDNTINEEDKVISKDGNATSENTNEASEDSTVIPPDRKIVSEDDPETGQQDVTGNENDNETGKINDSLRDHPSEQDSTGDSKAAADDVSGGKGKVEATDEEADHPEPEQKDVTGNENDNKTGKTNDSLKNLASEQDSANDSKAAADDVSGGKGEVEATDEEADHPEAGQQDVTGNENDNNAGKTNDSLKDLPSEQDNANDSKAAADDVSGEKGKVEATDEEVDPPQDTTLDDRDSVTGNSDEHLAEESTCEKCVNLLLVVEAVGGALDELQVDVNKQAIRLGRLMEKEKPGCNNCLKYQVVLAATYNSLDSVDKYSHLLGQRIDSLSRRILSC